MTEGQRPVAPASLPAFALAPQPPALVERSMAEKARLHVLIEGRVQGVFFRAYTRDEARSRGLTGWVRNLPDGRVQALFEGEKPALASMLAWCRQGPRYAYVESVAEDWQPYQGEFPDFHIRY